METLQESLRETKRKSPQYRALIQAVHAKADAETLLQLARAANVNANELADLRQDIATGLSLVEPAKLWPVLSKKWGRLEVDIEKVAKAIAKAKSDEEKAPLEKQRAELCQQRAALRHEFWRVEHAAKTVAAHRELGLLP